MNPSSLNSLRVGQSARVSHIEAEPAMRRRLLDIGLIPGTRVTCTAVPEGPLRGSGGLPDPRRRHRPAGP